jgi:hypothetical protein
VRDRRLEPVQGVVQRQEGVPPEGDNNRLLLWVRTVDRGSFGPILASAVVDRSRHFWIVVGLTP